MAQRTALAAGAILVAAGLFACTPSTDDAQSMAVPVEVTPTPGPTPTHPSPPLPAPPPTAIGGGPSTVQRMEAVDDIAQARCDRLAACSVPAAPPSGTFACLTREKVDLAERLMTEGCTTQIDGARLNKCVEDIREGESTATQCSAALPAACALLQSCGLPGAPRP